MLLVCEKHVKNGLHLLHVPHVQKLSHMDVQHYCIFCYKPAVFKLFYSISPHTFAVNPER